MATVKISEFSGPGLLGGQLATQAPVLPELRVTVLDTTSVTTLRLLSGTGLIVVTSDEAVAMSARGAISGGNLGVTIDPAPAQNFFSVPGPIAIDFTAG
jgi:hypothetical protein